MKRKIPHLTILYLKSFNFIRVQKNYFFKFEYWKMFKIFRVCSAAINDGKQKIESVNAINK